MDKDLALVIAEMLIKQDETTEQVKAVAQQVKAVGEEVKIVGEEVKIVAEQVKIVAERLQDTNDILKDFMGVSIKQWEQQHIFNEILVGEIKQIKVSLLTQAQIEARLKAVEERENTFESRLANVEKLLKAS